MSSVCCHNEIYLSDFDDDDILREAVKIIGRHRARGRPENERHREGWDLLQNEIDKVANAVGVVIPDERQLPPASTAASITTIEALRAYCSKQRHN